MRERQIGSSTRLNILGSSAEESASIWEQRCGLENGIKQKAAKNTADNKSNKKRSRLRRNTMKTIGEREMLSNSRYASGRSNVEFT
jgi:hypothetical protein